MPPAACSLLPTSPHPEPKCQPASLHCPAAVRPANLPPPHPPARSPLLGPDCDSSSASCPLTTALPVEQVRLRLLQHLHRQLSGPGSEVEHAAVGLASAHGGRSRRGHRTHGNLGTQAVQGGGGRAGAGPRRGGRAPQASGQCQRLLGAPTHTVPRAPQLALHRFASCIGLQRQLGFAARFARQHVPPPLAPPGACERYAVQTASGHAPGVSWSPGLRFDTRPWRKEWGGGWGEFRYFRRLDDFNSRLGCL